MKNFRSILSCFFVVALTGFHSPMSAESQEEPVKKVYAKVKDPKERLHLCIEMLSNGTIKRTMRLAELQKIFGDELVKIRALSDERDLWTVRFEEIPEISEPDYATGFRGWYLRLEIDKHDKLVNYYLSNIHK